MSQKESELHHKSRNHFSSKQMNITQQHNTAIQPIDIEALLQHAQQLAGNRLSKNTLKAYRSALRGWAKFCTGTGIDPEEISTESLAMYLTHLSSKNRRPATIDVHRAALRDVFRHRDKAAVFIDPRIDDVMKSIRRTQGTHKKQKDAVTIDEIRAAAKLPDEPSLIDIRDRAAILFGFAGAFRVSELSALMASEITFTPRGAKVFMPKSKTDQEGKGSYKGIERGQTEDCPVKALQEWLNVSGITTGPVFRGWMPQGMKTLDLKFLRASPLSTDRLRTIVKGRFQAIGLDVSNISFHSLRISLVTHAKTVMGKSNQEVRGTTLHTTDQMVNHYTNVADPFKAGVGQIGL